MKSGRVEKISFHKFDDLPEIEVLRADDSQRLWRWYHTAYCIATPINVRGTAEYVYRGNTYLVGPDDQPIMQPGEVHATRPLTGPATFRVLFIAPGFMTSTFETLGWNRHQPACPPRPLTQRRLLRSFLRLHPSPEHESSTS